MVPKNILIIGILTSFLILGFTKTLGSTPSSEPGFNLELLGFTGGEYFIGLPVPPNYTGTITPADIYAYRELIFQLSYHKPQVCNITTLTFWQTINTYDTLWNLTASQIDPQPPFSISTNQSLEFRVLTDYYFIKSGHFLLEIVTKTQGTFVLKTFHSKRFTYYSTWPLSTSPNSLPHINDSISLFFFLEISLIILIVKRRYNNCSWRASKRDL